MAPPLFLEETAMRVSFYEQLWFGLLNIWVISYLAISLEESLMHIHENGLCQSIVPRYMSHENTIWLLTIVKAICYRPLIGVRFVVFADVVIF